MQRFFLIGLIVAGLAGSSFFLFSAALHDPEIPFLPQDERAEWILYPGDPDTVARGGRQIDLEALFTRSFFIHRVPHRATARFRAFQDCRIRVNGREVLPEHRPDAGWKDPGTVDLSGYLQAGENRIAVKVHNKLGPPALWLCTSGLDDEVRTGAAWQVSLRAKPTANAAVADDCRLHPLCREGPAPFDALEEKLPLLIALFAFFLLIFWLKRSWSRIPALTPGAVLVISVTLWAVLFVNNVLTSPERLSPALGFDAPSHIEYMDYIVKNGSLPLASDGWEMYQPPLYYVAAAGVFQVAGLFLPEAGVIVAIRLITFLCGVGQIFLAFWAATILFPRRQRCQMLATAMAALVPMNLYISHYISNEALSAFLVSLSIVLTLRLLAREKSGAAGYCCLGLVVGLALLTKFTALSVAPILCLLLLWRLKVDRSIAPARAICLFGGMIAVVLCLAGWFYWRNWVHYGNPMVGNWDPASGHVWWQDPGFHTSRYYFQFGKVFLYPIFAGFYSFFDAIYCSFWGDGFYGGIASTEGRPPWNYGFMSLSYILAVPACLAAAGGLAAAVFRSLRRVDLQWLVILGSSFTMSFGILFLTVKLPFYAQSKAFYGLAILLPFSLFFAWGFDLGERFERHLWYRIFQSMLFAWFCTFGAVVFLTYLVGAA